MKNFLDQLARNFGLTAVQTRRHVQNKTPIRGDQTNTERPTIIYKKTEDNNKSISRDSQPSNIPGTVSRNGRSTSDLCYGRPIQFHTRGRYATTSFPVSVDSVPMRPTAAGFFPDNNRRGSVLQMSPANMCRGKPINSPMVWNGCHQFSPVSTNPSSRTSVIQTIPAMSAHWSGGSQDEILPKQCLTSQRSDPRQQRRRTSLPTQDRNICPIGLERSSSMPKQQLPLASCCKTKDGRQMVTSNGGTLRDTTDLVAGQQLRESINKTYSRPRLSLLPLPVPVGQSQTDSSMPVASLPTALPNPQSFVGEAKSDSTEQETNDRPMTHWQDVDEIKKILDRQTQTTKEIDTVVRNVQESVNILTEEVMRMKKDMIERLDSIERKKESLPKRRRRHRLMSLSSSSFPDDLSSATSSILNAHSNQDILLNSLSCTVKPGTTTADADQTANTMAQQKPVVSKVELNAMPVAAVNDAPQIKERDHPHPLTVWNLAKRQQLGPYNSAETQRRKSLPI